ncbi:MAG: M48 family metalloprotease [Rikenellaceae bacterium]|nr:M48 family metalloprotease [Rikenellaceae bacterium]
MNPILRYALEIVACSGVFALLYRTLIADRYSFRTCRRYLLATVTLALLIPLIELPLLPPAKSHETTPEQVQRLEFKTITVDYDDVQPSERDITRRNGRNALIACTYAALAAIIGLLTRQGVIDLRDLKFRSKVTHHEGYDIATSEQIKAPYSFMGTIYLAPDTPDEEREVIIAHERSHIAHRHSLEKLYMGAIRTIVWFNPFIWLADRWLAEVQEFEADRDVLDAGYDMTLYRSLIFRQIFGYAPDVQNGFYSLTRRRFEMMTTPRREQGEWWRMALVVVATLAMTAACGLSRREVSGRIIHPSQNIANEAIVPSSNVVSVGIAAGRDGIYYLSRNPRRTYRLEGNEIYVSTLLGFERKVSSRSYRHLNRPLYYIDGERVSAEQFRNRPTFLTESMNVYTGDEAVSLFGEEARRGVWAVTLRPDSRCPALLLDGRWVSLRQNLDAVDRAVRVVSLTADEARAKYGEGYPYGVIEAWDIVEKEN